MGAPGRLKPQIQFRLRPDIVVKSLGAASRAFQILLFILIARFQGAQVFGRFIYLYTLGLLAVTLADLGVNAVSARRAAAGGESLGRIAGAGLAFKLFSCAPLMMLMWYVLGGRGAAHPDLALLAVLLLGHWCRNLFEFFCALLASLRNSSLEAVLKFIIQAGLLAFGAWVLLRGGTLREIAWVLAAVYAFGGLLGWGIVRFHLDRVVVAFGESFAKMVSPESAALAATTMALASMLKIDAVLLPVLGRSAQEVGWYAASERIVAAAGILPCILMMAGFPAFSELPRRRAEEFYPLWRAWAGRLAIAGGITALALIFLKSRLVSLLYGPSFLPAGFSLSVLSLGLLFAFPNTILLGFLIAGGGAARGAGAAAGAFGVNAFMDFLLIPRFGYIGAAWGAVAGQMTLFAFGRAFLESSARLGPAVDAAAAGRRGQAGGGSMPRGAKVLFISLSAGSDAFRKKVEHLADYWEVTAVIPAANGARAAESKVRYIPLKPVSFGSSRFVWLPGLAKVIRRQRPDWIHLDEEPLSLAAYQAGREASRLAIPLVFFSWQNIFQQYDFPYAWVESRVHQSAQGAIAGTQEAREVLERKNFLKPVAVIPQFGVDPESFRPCLERPRRLELKIGDEVLIGYAGRLAPEKGLLLLLDAFGRLPESCRLLFLGDGPLRPELARRIAADSKLRARVWLHGRVPAGEAASWIQSLDILALPSVSLPGWKERFGQALVEAMACGVPVVSSSSAEMGRLVGEGGMVFQEKDLGNLYRCLKLLAENPGHRKRLGEMGRERVLKFYTHQRIAEATRRFYEKLARVSAQA